MEKKILNKTVKDIISVTLSNICNVIAGIIVVFVIPKIISIKDYGYYKTFTLYVGYVGLVSLGIIDGIVLLYGGKDYEDLDKMKFRAYFFVYLIWHFIVTLILMIFSLLFSNIDSRIICLFLALDIICSNFTGYFQYISQITMRFKELSIRNIIKSILTILEVLILFFLSMINESLSNYKVFILSIIIGNYILTIWYLHTYKDLCFGKREKISKVMEDIKNFIKIGFPLFFSYLCSSLILTIDRQFVNILWPLSLSNEYSIYAFAYNMLSLITVATTAISTVIYPNLKRKKFEDLVEQYDNIVSFMMCFLFISMIVIFPLNLFIKWFLPEYIRSLQIFRIIFPGLLISSIITVVIHNYYKSFNITKLYFVQTIIVLALSVLANYFAYIQFHSTIYISIASVIVMLIWFFISQNFLVKMCKVKWKKNTIALLVGIVCFYISTSVERWYLAISIYFIFLIIFVRVFFVNDIKKFLKKGE